LPLPPGRSTTLLKRSALSTAFEGRPDGRRLGHRDRLPPSSRPARPSSTALASKSASLPRLPSPTPSVYPSHLNRHCHIDTDPAVFASCRTRIVFPLARPCFSPLPPSSASTQLSITPTSCLCSAPRTAPASRPLFLPQQMNIRDERQRGKRLSYWSLEARSSVIVDPAAAGYPSPPRPIYTCLIAWELGSYHVLFLPTTFYLSRLCHYSCHAPRGRGGICV
jgi:hypothetical protein